MAEFGTSTSIAKPLAPARCLRQQRLRDNAFKNHRELRANLRLLTRREMSMMRLIEDAAEFVCSVAKVRWPVSAIRKPFPSSEGRAFHRSARRPDPDEARHEGVGEVMRVGVYLALIDYAPFVPCRYSIGSSTVMMCS